MLTIYRILGIGLFIIFAVSSLSLVAQPIINQDFESGIGNWWVDNGLWEVGVPSLGPQSTHSGVKCAGTILDGNYTPNENTRLISPHMILPTISPGEHIKLKFWYWFRINEDSYFGNDQGWVQISVNGGAWQTLAGPIEGWSPVWSQGYVDLSAYADSTVRIAFYFTSNVNYEDNGWYIDDISVTIEAPIFNNPEDFESGLGDWSADNGLWEFGIPSVWPDSAHSGQNCIGTILNGNYTTYAHTRLISPYIKLNPIPDSFVGLYYWYWFRVNEDSYFGNDQGWVQISVNGGAWKTLAGPISGYSPVWSQGYVDLSAYADSTVRIAFYFTSNVNYEDNGWYIDDVRIEGIITAVHENSDLYPREYKLMQNYPNPFNPLTNIQFSLPKASHAKIEVFNILGQKVASLVDEKRPAGYYTVQFDARNLSTGLYFYKIQAGTFSQVRKMLLTK